MKRLKYSLFLFAAIMLLAVACTGNKQGDSIDNSNSIDNRARQIIEDGLEKTRARLPFEIPDSPISIVEVSMDGDMIEIVATLPDSLLGTSTMFDKEQGNSDSNVASILLNFNQTEIETIINAGCGLRYIYKGSETGETLLLIDVSCERLKQIKEGMDSGEIVPYPTLELFQMAIEQQEFPSEIEEGMWLTDGYIKGNTVYYVAKFESDVTSDDLSHSELLAIKQDILQGLKEFLIAGNKKEMAQKGIRIIYIYKNNNGDEFARIEITADDI